MSARPFPPSPRRRALARRAGLAGHSPLVVGAAALGAAIATAAAIAGAASDRLGAAIEAACAGRAITSTGGIVSAATAIVAPVVVAAALAAIVAHVAQTRAVWFPRRTIAGAPAITRGPAARAGHAAIELVRAAAIGAVAFGWLWLIAPRLARLVEVSPRALAAATAATLASLVAALAIAVVVLGALDALVRHVEHARALAMTAADKREDERLAGADPRWRTQRARAWRAPSLRGATVVVVGDDVAVAIAWDPVRRPVPTRVATGHRARAAQLVGLARRDAIAIRRDRELAAALVDGDGAVPERYWARLADIIAPLRRMSDGVALDW